MSLEGWLGIIATIVVAVLFYFLQKSDYKKSNNLKHAEKKEYKRINLADINFVVPITGERSTEEPCRSSSVFGIRAVYNGYMTTITYTNLGGCEVKKVSVSVEQKTNETVSLTIVKNEQMFPIEMLNVGDSFDLEVECYYPKANRYFTVEWEDKAGKHSQRNHILLSKYYNV